MPSVDDECIDVITQEADAKFDHIPPSSYEISAQIEHKKTENVDKFSHEKQSACYSVTSEKMILLTNEGTCRFPLKLKLL